MCGLGGVAAVMGFVLHRVGTVVANLVFPRIAAEEAVGSVRRMVGVGAEEETLSPGTYPEADVNPLPKLPAGFDETNHL